MGPENSRGGGMWDREMLGPRERRACIFNEESRRRGNRSAARASTPSHPSARAPPEPPSPPPLPRHPVPRASAPQEGPTRPLRGTPSKDRAGRRRLRGFPQSRMVPAGYGLPRRGGARAGWSRGGAPAAAFTAAGSAQGAPPAAGRRGPPGGGRLSGSAGGAGAGRSAPPGRGGRQAARAAAWGVPQLGAALTTSYFVGAYGALLVGSAISPVGRVVSQALRRVGAMGAVVPLSLLYLAFLVPSWKPGTLQVLMPGSLEAGLQGGFRPQFFPQLSGIVALFSGSELTAGSFWVHILAGILFQAVQIFRDGRRRAVPTLHSLALGLAWGPAGLVSHFVTRAALGKGFSSDADDGGDSYVVYRF